MQEVVGRLHARGIKVIGATITSTLHCPILPNYGTIDVDNGRRTVNDFIRTSGIFDSVADMDAATIDPVTGELGAEFVSDSTKAAQETNCTLTVQVTRPVPIR